MRSPLSYLTFWFVPLLVRFNVYLGATKGLFDASVVLLLVTACTSSAIAMILGHPASRQKITQSPETK